MSYAPLKFENSKTPEQLTNTKPYSQFELDQVEIKFSGKCCGRLLPA